MIDDLETRDNLSIEADICIIGAGAAGITIAREFIGTNLSICLVESGGLNLDSATQSMYAGENIGLPYFPLDTCRLRYLGGTTNHWNGQSAEFSSNDFENRSWVPHSGWPITKATLEPYYQRARQLCGLNNKITDSELYDFFDMQQPDLDPELLRMFFFEFSSPLRFGEFYRSELETAANIRVLLNANVVDITTDESAQRVTAVTIKSLGGVSGGVSGKVCAKIFVIACGAIENARLLLNSVSTNPKGLGNDTDLVGRYFMEHPAVNAGQVIAVDPINLLKNYRRSWQDGFQYWPAFSLSENTQQRDAVLGASAVIDYTARADSGTMAAIEVGRSVHNTEIPAALPRKIWQILKDLDEVVPNAYRYLVRGKEPIAEPESMFFKINAEQAPNPDSRVTLSDETDALGLRRVQLDWQTTDIDKKTIEVMIRTLGIEFGRLGLGRVRMDDWLAEKNNSWQSQERNELQGGFHHMGTTRMAESPENGVVDANCRVHGMQNLFIAGSSVFPTSGHVHPTFNLVALALRLSDHLRSVV